MTATAQHERGFGARLWGGIVGALRAAIEEAGYEAEEVAA